MFDRVEIEGLKGVGEVRLSFDPTSRVRVLFGSNGVGKTKCLEALYEGLLFTNSDFLEHKQLLGDAGWPVMRKLSADGSLRFADGLENSMMLIHHQRKLAEEVFHTRPVVYMGAASRSSLPGAMGRSNVLGKFKDRRAAHFERLYSEIRGGLLASSGMTEDVRSWFVVRAQSVNPYQKESDNLQTEIDAVLGLLNEIDPRISSRDLTVDAAEHVFLMVEGKSRELGELSSGFASLLKLIQAIISGYANFSDERNLRSIHGVVLIDEIESHLHVVWQTTIVQKLKSMLPNTTFFVATHSPLILAQLEQGEGYLLERGDDHVVRSTEIDSPNMKAFADVLNETFGVDLNALKRRSLDATDQSKAKQALLDLLDREENP